MPLLKYGVRKDEGGGGGGSRTMVISKAAAELRLTSVIITWAVLLRYFRMKARPRVSDSVSRDDDWADTAFRHQ